MKKYCLECNKEFEAVATNQKYCCTYCNTVAYQRRHFVPKTYVCKWCKEEFTVTEPKDKRRKYCSDFCKSAFLDDYEEYHNETLCWHCDNLSCSWMKDCQPVDGWEAEKKKYPAINNRGETDPISYRVHKCPLFQKRIKKRLQPKKAEQIDNLKEKWAKLLTDNNIVATQYSQSTIDKLIEQTEEQIAKYHEYAIYERECLECGNLFLPTLAKQRFCCKYCGNKTTNKEYYLKKLPILQYKQEKLKQLQKELEILQRYETDTTRYCKSCGVEFVPAKQNQIYCCRKCSQRLYSRELYRTRKGEK